MDVRPLPSHQPQLPVAGSADTSAASPPSAAQPRLSTPQQQPAWASPPASSRQARSADAAPPFGFPVKSGSISPAAATRPKVELKPLSESPTAYNRVMNLTSRSIDTVRGALRQLDMHWNPETVKKMISLFGDDAKSSDTRASIRGSLAKAVDVLDTMRANKGKDLFLRKTNEDDSTIAESYRKKSVYTGRMSFSEANMNKLDDKELMKTVIHEALHVGASLDDRWYVKIDENGEFFRKKPSSLVGELPPLTTASALDNADSLARGAVVLSENRQTHDELRK